MKNSKSAVLEPLFKFMWKLKSATWFALTCRPYWLDPSILFICWSRFSDDQVIMKKLSHGCTCFSSKCFVCMSDLQHCQDSLQLANELPLTTLFTKSGQLLRRLPQCTTRSLSVYGTTRCQWNGDYFACCERQEIRSVPTDSGDGVLEDFRRQDSSTGDVMRNVIGTDPALPADIEPLSMDEPTHRGGLHPLAF